MINTLITAITYGLKAFFSLLTWFMKAFLRFLKFCYVFLPITSIVFVLLFLLNIFTLATGQGIMPGQGPMPQPEPLMDNVLQGQQITRSVFGELKSWWITSIYSYHGQSAYIPLFILTILMFVPVMTVFLCLTVLLSYSRYLFFAVAADAIWYLLRAILGKNFISQAAGRYFRVFPEAGRRHEERVYDRNLRKQNREFERMEKDKKRERASSFYEDEDEDEDSFYDGHDRGYDRNNRDYDKRGGRYDRHNRQRAYRGYEEDYAPEYDEDYEK